MSSNYYTKTEVDAFLAYKFDKESSVDLEFTVSGKGVIFRNADGTRRWRLTINENGIPQTVEIT
jgi:hypothetical protein